MSKYSYDIFHCPSDIDIIISRYLNWVQIELSYLIILISSV